MKNGKILWKELIPDDGFHSSAAIADGKVFIGTMNGMLISWGKGKD